MLQFFTKTIDAADPSTGKAVAEWEMMTWHMDRMSSRRLLQACRAAQALW